MAFVNFNGLIYPILLLLSFSVIAEQEIAIISPSLSQTYDEILDGIKESTPKFKNEILSLEKDNKEEIISKLLRNEQLVALVAIGKPATEITDSIPLKVPVITTGILSPEDNKHRGISLSFSDQALKNKIKQILPHITKLHIGNDGSHIIRFTKNSNTLDFIQTAIHNDENSVVKYLWNTINNANPDTDAVWVNHNISHLYLYKLSELAWERKVALLTNNIDYLESGVLLAFYPDFKMIGHRVGEILNKISSNKNTSYTRLKMEPLLSINSGINARASAHLGIQIPPEIENKFGIIIK